MVRNWITFNALRTLRIPGIRYIKPEHFFRHREAISAASWLLFPEHWQVNVLVYAWKKRIFPSASTLHLGHSKVEMTRAFWAVCPEHVPYTEILANTETNVRAVLDTFTFPFIAKEVRSARGCGVYVITDEAAFQAYAARSEVLYVQELLPIDRDIRVVVVGNNVLAAYWRIGRPGIHVNNVAQGGTISFEPVPRSVIDLVVHVARTLGIDHAGFDVALVDGHPYLLEFNALFGNEALNRLGIRVEEAIVRYLEAHETPFTPHTPLHPSPSVPRAS